MVSYWGKRTNHQFLHEQNVGVTGGQHSTDRWRGGGGWHCHAEVSSSGYSCGINPHAGTSRYQSAEVSLSNVIRKRTDHLLLTLWRELTLHFSNKIFFSIRFFRIAQWSIFSVECSYETVKLWRLWNSDWHERRQEKTTEQRSCS